MLTNKNFILICFLSFLVFNISLTQNSKWKKLSYPEGSRIEQILFNSDDDIFITTCWHSDSYTVGGTIYRIERSTNQGQTWDTVFNAGWQTVTVAVDLNDDLYACVFKKILKSTDNGDTWHNLVNNLSVSFIHTIAFSPNGYIFIGANNSNYRSKDNGKNWELIPLEYQATKYLFLKNGNILAGVNSGYFPNPPQYIYCSMDSGNSWQRVLNADKTYGWSFVNSCNGGAFAATAEYDSSLGGVYRSIDNGFNWSRVNTGLPSRKVNDLVITSSDILFAAIKGEGIFKSTDCGGSWTNFTNGLEDLRIQCLAINSKNQLFVGTASDSLQTKNNNRGGIYCYDDITSVENRIVVTVPKFQLLQNYPNPFNPTTAISYHLPAGRVGLPAFSKVLLTVYDVLGREVVTLVNQQQPAGKYEVTFDGSKLPSGIYLCRLQANEYVETKKILLLK